MAVDQIEGLEKNIVFTTLTVSILMYLALFGFLLFNVHRIMIRLRKYTLIPLVIFYTSATCVVVSRIISNAAYMKYYAQGQPATSRSYTMGMKASIVANFTNILIGIFQVASIIELFFVLGGIKQATLANKSEPEQPSLLGIAITYFFASAVALGCLGFLIYLLLVFENTESYFTLVHSVSADLFIALSVFLTVVSLMLAIRLMLLRRMKAPVEDGKRALTRYYLVFMVGYITRVVVDQTILHYQSNTFLTEMLFDVGQIFWDALPIFCILLFHFSNFKPYQDEFIIRITQVEDGIESEATCSQGEKNFLYISDGMLFGGSARLSKEELLARLSRSLAGSTKIEQVFNFKDDTNQLETIGERKNGTKKVKLVTNESFDASQQANRKKPLFVSQGSSSVQRPVSNAPLFSPRDQDGMRQSSHESYMQKSHPQLQMDTLNSLRTHSQAQSQAQSQVPSQVNGLHTSGSINDDCTTMGEVLPNHGVSPTCSPISLGQKLPLLCNTTIENGMNDSQPHAESYNQSEEGEQIGRRESRGPQLSRVSLLESVTTFNTSSSKVKSIRQKTVSLGAELVGNIRNSDNLKMLQLHTSSQWNQYLLNQQVAVDCSVSNQIRLGPLSKNID